jgi:hypothetical protein
MRHTDPVFSLVDAQIALASGDLVGALEGFDRAHREASTMRMRPVAAEALNGAASVLDLLGRRDAAEQYRLRWRQALDEMRDLMTDAALRDAYERANGVPVHG